MMNSAPSATPLVSPSGPSSVGEVETRLPADPRSGRQARRFFTEHAIAAGFSGDTVDDMEVAVGEAITNAIEHGCRALAPDTNALAHQVILQVRWDSAALYITITDTGAGFYPGATKTTAPGDSENERGRGLFLMSHLMDDVAFVAIADGWSVRMTKYRTTPAVA